MNLTERRALLEMHSNADRKLDCLVTLSGHLPSGGAERQAVRVRYVPDKLILEARSFGVYLEALAETVWSNPEDLAVTVISDLSNETVSRWMQISVSVPELNHHAVETHDVTIEDRQPGWDNASLLGRLERV